MSEMEDQNKFFDKGYVKVWTGTKNQPWDF